MNRKVRTQTQQMDARKGFKRFFVLWYVRHDWEEEGKMGEWELAGAKFRFQDRLNACLSHIATRIARRYWGKR